MHSKSTDIFNRLKKGAFCKIQPSAIHGVGVFAIKDIPAKICPWVTPNHHFTNDPYLLTTDDLNRLDRSIKDTLLDYNLKESDGLYISPHELEVFHLTQFLNASKKPNLDFLFDTTGEFITNREIKKGEELTVDYQKSLQNTNITYNHQY
tara:strand:+ start:136 stop:585 length:450 start_codon:yes stop_codon:yes gene_type:complete